MKLPEHVAQIKERIDKAFDKHLSRLGLGETRIIEFEKLPEELHEKRTKIDRLIDSHKDEKGNYNAAREKAKEELTFTLFNRLAAIKVMEAHMLFPEIITRRPEHGDRSFGHKAWLEEYPNMRNEELEGFREYLKYEFDQLGDEFPLFHKDYPYALLPYVIDLNEIISAFDAVAADPNIQENIWQSDDILGWFYESYNNDKKIAHKESKAKTEYDKVSTQSQVYTPRWVVKFLVDNSLGKLYLEMFPDSSIKDKYQIANAPSERVRPPKKLTKVRLIDPACGSGNFELYAFDLFYDLYLDQINNYDADYDISDIPRLIIEHNLHGIDLDDRAVQLAHLGLYIKAKRKNRNIGSLTFNVVSSDFFLPDYEEVKHIFEGVDGLEDIQKNIVRDTWGDLQNAHKFGSLIRIKERIKQQINILEDKSTPQKKDLFTDMELNLFHQFEAQFFKNLDKAVDRYAKSQSNTFLSSKTKDAITFLKLLTQSYDVAVANPPYTDSADFGKDLKVFIEDNYKKPYKFHTNLYATFIKRSFELTNEQAKIALVHPRTFMYIKSFEGVRKYILENSNINLLVELGSGGVFELTNVAVDAVMYTIERNIYSKEGIYFDLKFYHNYTKKGEIFNPIYQNHFAGVDDGHKYILPQSKLKVIKSWPFIYWISDAFREKFASFSLDRNFKTSQGMSVSNGERFLRFHWELAMDTSFIKTEDWPIFPKGGPFKKWAGNLWLNVDWRNDGQDLKNFKKAVLRNKQYYFLDGITYSSSGSKGSSFRSLPKTAVISGGGPGIHPKNDKFSINYCIAYLNSKFGLYTLNCLNPTVNTTQGDLNRVPLFDITRNGIELIDQLSSYCIFLSSKLLNYSIFERDYKGSPLSSSRQDLKNSIKKILDYENFINCLVILSESYIDDIIIDEIDIPSVDKENIFKSEGVSLGGLEIEKEAKEEFLKELKINKNIDISLLNKYINNSRVKFVDKDLKNKIINELLNLYQKNNSFEDFCFHHRINPINLWYWFKESKIIPQHRMNDLAMEFVADLIRELLMEDDDGIIPLIPNAGEKILLDRIEEKFYEKGFSSSQYSSFEKVLGRALPDYINHHFFAHLSDHLNLYMYLPKTPFIWHLTSGPEQGFDCYIIIYKWNKDKLYRLRSIYLEHRERALINRREDLKNNESAAAQNEKEKIRKQLDELELFKKKIDELLAEGYDPILDDGVGKNIAPLQAKGMLAYEVLNKGQLKKYLNADW